MNQINKTQKGFAIISLIIAIVLSLGAAGIGYVIVRNDINKKKNNEELIIKQKTKEEISSSTIVEMPFGSSKRKISESSSVKTQTIKQDEELSIEIDKCRDSSSPGPISIQRIPCYAQIAIKRNNPSVCDKLEELSDVRYCYNEFVLQSKNTKICDQIFQSNSMSQSKLEKESYGDECYDVLARSQKDYDICGKINNEIRKNTCYTYIAQIKKLSFICEKIDISTNEGKILKQNCAYLSKKDGEDINACIDLNDKDLREACIQNQLARVDNLDSSYCENLTNQEIKDSCYERIAIFKAEQSFCSIIKNLEKKDMCYSEVAKNIVEPEICSKISNIQIKDMCYVQMIILMKDKSFCSKIVDNKLRTECLNQ